MQNVVITGGKKKSPTNFPKKRTIIELREIIITWFFNKIIIRRVPSVYLIVGYEIDGGRFTIRVLILILWHHLNAKKKTPDNS